MQAIDRMPSELQQESMDDSILFDRYELEEEVLPLKMLCDSSPGTTKCTHNTLERDSGDERTRRKIRLHENLKALRDLVPADGRTADADPGSTILSRACTYIKELRERVVALKTELRLDEELPISFCKLGQPELTIHNQTSFVEVSSLHSGLQIHVNSENRPGLLLTLLQALENKGLNVTHANVSYQSGFTFDAIAIEHEARVEINDLKTIIVEEVLKGCGVPAKSEWQ